MKRKPRAGAGAGAGARGAPSVGRPRRQRTQGRSRSPRRRAKSRSPRRQPPLRPAARSRCTICPWTRTTPKRSPAPRCACCSCTSCRYSLRTCACACRVSLTKWLTCHMTQKQYSKARSLLRDFAPTTGGDGEVKPDRLLFTPPAGTSRLARPISITSDGHLTIACGRAGEPEDYPLLSVPGWHNSLHFALYSAVVRGSSLLKDYEREVDAACVCGGCAWVKHADDV